MTEASTSTGSPSRSALPVGPVWRAGLLAAVAATVVNAVAWLVLQSLLGADLQVPSQPGGTELVDLPLIPVILVTLFSGLLGAVVLWLLTRRGAAGIRLLRRPHSIARIHWSSRRPGGDRRAEPPRSLRMRYASRVAVLSSQTLSRSGCASEPRCCVKSSQVTWLTSAASSRPRPWARATVQTIPPYRSTSWSQAT
jgi:Family of unknown function (DUF6069)